MIGKTISHYKILEKLGEGGMGVVYKAEDTKLNRMVALKFLPHHLTSSEADKARFLQEARAAAALNHNNVCTIYEIYDEGEDPFIAMEYIKGTTLRHLSVNNEHLPLEKVIEYAIQIGEALKEAHKNSIIHRDIKSDNIMINNNNQVKVMDFGLAKLKGSVHLTKTSSTIGTLAYMAPEQIEGKEIDARSDIFSFGVVLYEMLTGQLPFKGEYDSATMYSIINEEPEPVLQYRPDLSSEWLHLMNRSLEKEPGERYQSMNDLLIDLRRLKRDTGRVSREFSKAIPDIQKSQVRRTGFKFKKLLPFALVILVLMIAFVAYFTFVHKQKIISKRIPVAIVDFINETNEPELNSLSGIFITALEPSKHLSVLTRSRMLDILKSEGSFDIEKIDETLGNRICKIADVMVMIIPTIRKLGHLYVIDLKVIDPQKNEFLFAAKDKGEGQESIYTIIDNLAEKTRRELKEKESEIQVSSQKVAEVTTPSLEAYQHYFKGEELINQLKFEKAQEQFREAIALDSTFGLAYYRLAYAISWILGVEDLAREPLQKALIYIDRIPAKERYMVRAELVQLEDGFEAAIEVLKQMEKIYPDDKEMIYNIGDWNYHIGHFSQSITYLKKVLAMDSTHIRALQHITWNYRDLDQPEKMRHYARKYINVSPTVESYDLLAKAYIGLGDFETALNLLLQVRNNFPNPDDLSKSIINIYNFGGEYDKAEAEALKLIITNKPLKTKKSGYNILVGTYPYTGKYRSALDAIDILIDMHWQTEDTAMAVYWQLSKGHCITWGWNKTDEAWKEAQKTFPFQKQANYANYWASLSLLNIICGNYTQAERTAVSIPAKWWDLTVRSLIQIKKQEYQKAKSSVDTLLYTGPGFAKIMVLHYFAELQYINGDLDKSIQSLQMLQRIYDNTFGFRAVYYPTSYYLLGKIYEKKGNHKLAVANYNKFLNLWKNADDDLPDLIDAKQRLAALTGEN